MLRYPARYEAAEEGGYVIEIPDLDIMTEGDTMKELLEMAEDALNGVLTVRYEENLDIPHPSRETGDNVVFIDAKPEVAIPILLKQSRIEQGLSQSEIAEKIKAPFQTIQKLEKIGSNPTIRTLQKIGKALGKRVVIDLV